MATSKLQIQVGNLLDKELPEFFARENYRPDWMISRNNSRLELDFFLEKINIAIEVQGEQHYSFIPFFHGTRENYEKQKENDIEKKTLCEGRNIKFVEIFSYADAVVLVNEIKDKYLQKPKYFYSYDEEIKTKKRLAYSKSPDPNSRKSQKKVPELGNKNRLELVKQRMKDYLDGKIEASADKVYYWQQAIENNGEAIND